MQVIDSEGYLKVKLVGGPAGPFVPYTGATANVDLGEYEIKVGQLELDQTPTGTAGVAVMRWNDADGTADLGLKGGNVTLQIGQEQVTRVVNKTGVNLLEANYQAVRVDGAQGNRLKVALAQANNDANSADTLGLVTETINDNQEGFVTVSGLVRNINTTGSIQTETWLDGDVLYLSGTVAGQITNIKPAAPIHTVIMGYVVRAHATQGQIYVKVDNGYELDELHNVAITTPLNDQVLQYETATSLWKNKTISTGITIGTTAITSGTVGRVLFEGTGNVVQESANLTWDNTNSRLALNGTLGKLMFPAPEISFGSRFNGIHFTDSTYATSYGYLSLSSGFGEFRMFAASSYFPTFYSNGAERMRIFTTGNIGINTTTDAGFKLDVNGTARVSGVTTITNADVANPDVGPSAFQITNGTFAKFAVVNDANRCRVNLLGTSTQGLRIEAGANTNVTVIGGGGLTLSATSNNFSISANTFLLNTGGSERMRIASTGNVAIGTTTDAGYKLDVVGTIRATYITTPLIWSTGSDALTLATQGGTSAVTVFPTTRNVLIQNGGTPVDAGYKLDVNGTARVGVLTCGNINPSSTTNVSGITFSTGTMDVSSNNDMRLIIPTSAKGAIVSQDYSFLSSASALFEVKSTTKGFLPPRQTQAQRTAIASPAVGLVVFQTDATEGLYVYKSTGWVLLL